MRTQPEIETTERLLAQLDRIADALERIADTMEKGNTQEEK